LRTHHSTAHIAVVLATAIGIIATPTLLYAERPSDTPQAPRHPTHHTDASGTSRVLWEPSYKYEEDNFDREYWQTVQRLGVELAKRVTGFIEYLHASFREQAIQHVTEEAVGAGVRSTLLDHHKLQLKFLEHTFSDPVDRQTSWEAKADSQWTETLQTSLLVGREPADTAQALQSGIRQDYYETRIEWTPREQWHLSVMGVHDRLIDRNRRYKTEWQLGRELPWVPGLQAVALYSFDNMIDRRPEYYSPHRVKSYQAGFSYWGTPTPKTWVWGRYVPGYGKESGVDSWFVHVLDLSAGIQLTPNWSLNASLGLSRSPTYRSRTYVLASTLRF